MTERRGADGSGPVPVRDLLKQISGEPSGDEKANETADDAADAAPPDAGTGPEAAEFEMAGEDWVAREAGAGSYGTGKRGIARLLAVHFFRASTPDLPVREALIPAGTFGSLRSSELRELFERATPIELDRDRS